MRARTLTRETTTTLQTEPSQEPISTSEMKTHLRQDLSDEDTLIDSLITTARRKAEQFTNRVFITQNWKLFLPDFPSVEFQEIPKPPLQTVNSVKYTLKDDTEKTFSASNYRVDTDREPGVIAVKEDQDWPNPEKDLRVVNGVEIDFDAGYGDSQNDVPGDIKTAIKMIVAHLYEHRQEVVLNTIVREIPHGAESLLFPYKVKFFG